MSVCGNSETNEYLNNECAARDSFFLFSVGNILTEAKGENYGAVVCNVPGRKMRGVHEQEAKINMTLTFR